MLVVSRDVLKLELVKVVMLVVLDTVQGYLHVLRCGGPALRHKIGDNLSLVDFGDALDGEGPEDLLADHHQYLALVHAAGVGDEGEGDFENAEGLDFELALGCIQQPEYLLPSCSHVNHLHAHCDVVLEGISELD